MQFFKEIVTFRNNLGKFTNDSFQHEKSSIIWSRAEKSIPVNSARPLQGAIQLPTVTVSTGRP